MDSSPYRCPQVRRRSSQYTPGATHMQKRMPNRETKGVNVCYDVKYSSSTAPYRIKGGEHARSQVHVNEHSPPSPSSPRSPLSPPSPPTRYHTAESQPQASPSQYSRSLQHRSIYDAPYAQNSLVWVYQMAFAGQPQPDYPLKGFINVSLDDFSDMASPLKNDYEAIVSLHKAMGDYAQQLCHWCFRLVMITVGYYQFADLDYDGRLSALPTSFPDDRISEIRMQGNGLWMYLFHCPDLEQVLKELMPDSHWSDPIDVTKTRGALERIAIHLAYLLSYNIDTIDLTTTALASDLEIWSRVAGETDAPIVEYAARLPGIDTFSESLTKLVAEDGSLGWRPVWNKIIKLHTGFNVVDIANLNHLHRLPMTDQMKHCYPL